MDAVKYVHVKIGLPSTLTEPEAAARVAGIVAYGQTLAGQVPDVELMAFESPTGGIVAFDGVTPCPNACTDLFLSFRIDTSGNGHYIEIGEDYEVEGDMAIATMLSQALDAIRRAGHAHWVAVNLNDGRVV